MFPTISHILYDLGNTLLYFEGGWEAVFRHAVAAAAGAAGRFGMDETMQAALADRLAARLQANYDRRDTDLIEQPAGEIFTAAVADLGIAPAGRELCAAVMAAFYTATQRHWIPVPGAQAALAALEDRGYRQAVLSNAAHDPDVQALVDKARLRPHLDFVLTSAAIGRRKPDPAAFRRAAETWGIQPAAILMVGDTLGADIKGARQAGMACAWARKYSGDLPGEVRPDAVVETVVDLPVLLMK